MPRYFFDVDDGDRAFKDDEGSVLADDEEARREAIGILPDIARDVLPDGDNRVFVSKVRTEGGDTIFMATLSLRAKWL